MSEQNHPIANVDETMREIVRTDFLGYIIALILALIHLYSQFHLEPHKPPANATGLFDWWPILQPIFWILAGYALMVVLTLLKNAWAARAALTAIKEVRATRPVSR